MGPASMQPKPTAPLQVVPAFHVLRSAEHVSVRIAVPDVPQRTSPAVGHVAQ
jgi:hypothetical protein